MSTTRKSDLIGRNRPCSLTVVMEEALTLDSLMMGVPSSHRSQQLNRSGLMVHRVIAPTGYSARTPSV